MSCLAFIYNGNWRDLRKIILALLKSWAASKIQKFNYGQSFELKDKSLLKKEIKLLYIYADDENKLMEFLGKNFDDLKRINVN